MADGDVDIEVLDGLQGSHLRVDSSRHNRIRKRPRDGQSHDWYQDGPTTLEGVLTVADARLRGLIAESDVIGLDITALEETANLPIVVTEVYGGVATSSAALGEIHDSLKELMDGPHR